MADYLEVHTEGGQRALLARDNPPLSAEPHPGGKAVTKLTFPNGIVHIVLAHWHELAAWFGVVVHRLDPQVGGAIAQAATVVEGALPVATTLLDVVTPIAGELMPASLPVLAALDGALPVVGELADALDGVPEDPGHVRTITGKQVHVDTSRLDAFVRAMEDRGGSLVEGTSRLAPVYTLPSGEVYSFLDYTKGRPLPALPATEPPGETTTRKRKRRKGATTTPPSDLPPDDDTADDAPPADDTSGPSSTVAEE